MIHKKMFARVLAVCALVALFVLPNKSVAQTSAAQSPAYVEGRVFNAATGAALGSARITIQGSNLFAETDDIGFYRIGPLQPGSVLLTITYAGLETSEALVTVVAGQTVLKDFELALPRAVAPKRADDETVVLEKFTIVSDREMSAQALALNERKTAGNIKNVVAFEEYNLLADENVGEFFRYMPGVTVEESGDTPTGISLRGVPSANTVLQLNGADLASASGSRSQSLLGVPVGNLSRVEVTKSPTPDVPASALGGSINLVSTSGFGNKRARFDYRIYYTFIEHNVGVEGGPPGIIPSQSPKFQQPSAKITYTLPVSRKFAINLSLARTWRSQPMDEDRTDTQADWNFRDKFQRVSTWRALSHVYQTLEATLGFQWRVSRSGMLTVNFAQKHYDHELLRSMVMVEYGAGATGGQYHVDGSAASNGKITQGDRTNQQGLTDTTLASFNYTHSWAKWKLNVDGSWSRNQRQIKDISNGYFNAAPANISGIEIHGEGIGENDSLIPVRFTARKNGLPIDVYSGANYAFESPTSEELKATSNRYIARADLSREFFWSNVSMTLKAGGRYDYQEYEQDPNWKTWTFRAPTGVANLASNFDVFDQSYNLYGAPRFGERRMEWVNPRKMYQLYLKNKALFTLNEVATHKDNVNNDKYFAESVSAGYIRADFRLFSNRLWIIAGVRYEHTQDDLRGIIPNLDAVYQKDANGNVYIDPATLAPVRLPNTAVNSIEEARLQYVRRSSIRKPHYDGFFPSVNMSYTLTSDIIIRAAYSRTIGRPDLTWIVPGMNTTTEELGTIVNIRNPNLKPWTANGYDLSFEFYGIKDVNASFGIFQKDFKNFFGAIVGPGKESWFTDVGGYWPIAYQENPPMTRIRFNSGDARVIGYEFTWTQKLTFLPYWARGIKFFFNFTKLELSGSNTADFSGYAPENYAGGLELIRPRYSIKLHCTYQGETQGAMVSESASNGILPNTYSYRGETLSPTLSAEYNFSKRFGVYFVAKDAFVGKIALTRRYSPGTPEYMKDTRRQDLGMSFMVGVKGMF